MKFNTMQEFTFHSPVRLKTVGPLSKTLKNNQKKNVLKLFIKI